MSVAQYPPPVASPQARVDRILNLPPLPAVACKLLQVLSKPNFTLLDVSQLIRSDAVFAGEVLRLANSVLLGLRYEVVSIMHAISVLGVDRLQNLVLTVAMRDFIRGSRNLRMLRLCWRHNLAAALAAEALAEACGIAKSEAYIAGLMHDLGRLAMIAAYPVEYSDILECGGAEGERLDLEERLLGINHRQAGGLLARAWGLPLVLHQVVCMDCAPARVPLTVVRVSFIACGLASRMGFPIGQCQDGWDSAWLEAELPPAVWGRVAPQAERLREQIPLKINLFECEFLAGS